jgi:hypothetical protein
LCGENISTKILNQKKYNEEPRKIQDAYANHPNIASTGIAQTINIDAQTTPFSGSTFFNSCKNLGVYRLE